MSLERHEGVNVMTEFRFSGELSLQAKYSFEFDVL